MKRGAINLRRNRRVKGPAVLKRKIKKQINKMPQKNSPRAEAIRKKMIQFLNTAEVKEVFETTEFRTKDEFLFTEQIDVSARCISDSETCLSVRNNSNDGYKEFRATFKV